MLWVTVGLKQLMLEQFVKFGKLGIVIIGYIFPITAQLFKDCLIFLEHFYILWFKIFSLKYGILWVVVRFCIQFFFYFLIRQTCLQQVVYVKIGRNKDLVTIKHINHVLVCLTEIVQRYLKCIETAFKSFYQSIFTDSCQTATYQFGIVVQAVCNFGFQISNSLITSICQLFVKSLHSFLKQIGQMFIQFISVFYRTFNFWKSIYILVIPSYIFNVGSCTTDGQRFYDTVAHSLCQLFELRNIKVRISS